MRIGYTEVLRSVPGHTWILGSSEGTESHLVLCSGLLAALLFPGLPSSSLRVSTSQHALGTSFPSPAHPLLAVPLECHPLQIPRSLVDPSARFAHGVELPILLPPLLKAGVTSVCPQFTGAGDGTQGIVQATRVLYQWSCSSRPCRSFSLIFLPILRWLGRPPGSHRLRKAYGRD